MKKDNGLLQDLEPETYPDRRIRLILDNQGSKHSIILHRWLLILIVLLVVAGLILVGFYGFKGQSAEEASRLRKLETENNYLRGKLDLYEAEIDSINSRLDTLTVYERELDTAYPYYAGGKTETQNRLQVNPGLIKKLDSIEYKLAILKQTEFGFADATLLYELPQDFDTHGDGIPAIYPTFGRMSDGWGWRYHPVTLEFEFHKGLDIANKTGTPVYATADGVVSKARRENGFGKVITIEHTDGYQSLYGHLDSFEVRPGQVVCKGQIIGAIGNTGVSTGPHLHYGVSRNETALNPTLYLNRIDTNTYAGR
ncbi:MAG: M23 family metallopeptidase [Candidatus Syntrophosphaera sp.]